MSTRATYKCIVCLNAKGERLGALPLVDRYETYEQWLFHLTQVKEVAESLGADWSQCYETQELTS